MTTTGEPAPQLLESSKVHAESPVKESILGKHFSYTIVFGQGPVQEKVSVPEAGRRGLNLYSRLNALAAAEMLENGITDKLILSGGKTGARAETDEGKTEAELMADIIRRHITHLSADGKSFDALGKKVELMQRSGEKKTQVQIDTEIENLLKDKILIENQSKNTTDNFAYVINKYLDQPETSTQQIALFGIDFQTGRLGVLSDIFGLGNEVFSAENVIKELIVNRRPEGSSVRTQLERLADLSLTDEVTHLKSGQEEILVRALRGGDWLRASNVLTNPEHLKQAVLRDSYVMEQLALVGYPRETIEQFKSDDLLTAIRKVKQIGVDELGYNQVKKHVFERLQEMTEQTGTDYYGLYAKGELPKT